jgi:hypothetical protein
MPKTITQLPAAAVADNGAVVAADNAAGSVTEKVTLAQIVALPHTHDAQDLTSGTVATARLGSGSATSTTFLAGDQSWKTVTSGSTNASDLNSGTLADARLSDNARAAINLYLWSTFR